MTIDLIVTCFLLLGQVYTVHSDWTVTEVYPGSLFSPLLSRPYVKLHRRVSDKQFITAPANCDTYDNNSTPLVDKGIDLGVDDTNRCKHPKSIIDLNGC